eukprot:1890508-Rhodomonas_salina.3
MVSAQEAELAQKIGATGGAAEADGVAVQLVAVLAFVLEIRILEHDEESLLRVREPSHLHLEHGCDATHEHCSRRPETDRVQNNVKCPIAAISVPTCWASGC